MFEGFEGPLGVGLGCGALKPTFHLESESIVNFTSLVTRHLNWGALGSANLPTLSLAMENCGAWPFKEMLLNLSCWLTSMAALVCHWSGTTHNVS